MVSARCSFAYDVVNELVLDAKIAPRRSCEKELAFNHIKHLNANSDILVFDRGYPCHWLIGLLMKEDFKFCFWLSTAWRKATTRMNEGEDDVDWVMKHNTHKTSDEMKRYQISKQIHGLRLVAVDLPSGIKEILLTNLTDRNEFSLEDIKRLYHLRWGVEEAYKSFKKTLHIEHFTGRTTLAIRQDFHARVFMLNMASMIRTQAVNKKHPKNKQQANKTQVLAKTKDFLFDLFYKQTIKKLIQQMIKLLDSALELIRPNRSFKRPETSSRRRNRIQNSKGI